MAAKIVEMTEAEKAIVERNLVNWQQKERVRKRNEKQQRQELLREQQRKASLRGGVQL